MTNRIYAYTVVGKDDEPWERAVGQRRIIGKGLIKVGQTTKATARARIKQQLGTAYPKLDGVEILLDEPAVKDDGTEFTDYEVHEALVKAGIRRPGGEWFEATLEEVRAAINKVQFGHAVRRDTHRLVSVCGPSRREAVDLTARLLAARMPATTCRQSSSGTRRCASARRSRPTNSPRRWAGPACLY